MASPSRLVEALVSSRRVALQLEVRQVPFSTLASLKREAVKEHLSFKDTAGTTWFAGYLGDELIGCAGMIWCDAQHHRIRAKSLLILPEWRGFGYGRQLNLARLAWAQDSTEAAEIDAYPKRKMVPMWTRLGFEVVYEPKDWGGRKFLLRKQIAR